MVHLRILGALLAFAFIAQCRDPAPSPPQPAPDPGPNGALYEAQQAADQTSATPKEVRL
jgi:hypothetical protein